jgi:two-component system phosphate regulon sensor histidine kinase PhoR
VLTMLLVAVIGFSIFDIIFYRSIRNYLFEQKFDEMRMKTRLAVLLLEEKPRLSSFSENFDALYDLTYQLATIVDSRVTIIATNGKVLTDSDVLRDKVQFMDNHLDRPEVQQARAKGWGQSYRDSDTIKHKLFYTVFPLKHDGQTIGFLRLAYYAGAFENSMRHILMLILGANLVGLVVLLLASLYTGWLVTFPLLKIVSIAQKISAGDLDKKFVVRRKDEIGTLTTVLNQLTERLKIQIKQISNERSKLLNILTNLNVGVIVVNQQKNILHANPQMMSILNLQKEEYEDDDFAEILKTEPLAGAIENTLNGGEKLKGELTSVRGENKIFLSFIVMPFFLSDERESGALIQIQDLTELKRLEAIRRDFVANASHELKTPLTAILGYAETLLEGAADEPQARMRFIRRIHEQSQRLEFLVTDLLKLSELERDVPFDLKSAKLKPLIEEVIADFQDASSQKEIKILCKAPDDLCVRIDQEGIRTVFSNLIDNAIKYTPQSGTITIRVVDVKNHWVKIEILDTGIGIDLKYHERIFQRFYRVDKVRSRTLGGTGLGLAIVKHIIELHGSKIHLQSEPGSGSCFWFELKKA